MKKFKELKCDSYNFGLGNKNCLTCQVVDEVFARDRYRRESLSREQPVEQGANYNEHLSDLSANIEAMERYGKLIKTHKAIIALRITGFVHEDIQELLSVSRSTVKRVLGQFRQ